MPAPRDVHRASTRVMSVAMVVIGVALIVVTLVKGGGPLAVGVLMGLLFVGAGSARLWLERDEQS